MKKKQVLSLTQAAMIAALYVVLTLIANAFGLASNVIQVRLSEMLTVLPFFTAAAVPGLAVGCLLSNLLTGAILPDLIFGTAATLIGALGTRFLRKYKWLAPVPPIMANTLIVPWILKFGYGFSEGVPFMMVTVGIGEVISCGVLGMLLLAGLKKSRIFAYQ